MFKTKIMQFFLLLFISTFFSVNAHNEAQATPEKSDQVGKEQKAEFKKRKPKKARFVKGDKNEHLNVKKTNICPKNRWKQIEYQNQQGTKKLVANEDLFEQLPTTIEELARHKDQKSISLSTFSLAGDSIVSVKFCSEKNLTFTNAEVKEKKLRLVLNQKGGIKLIAYMGVDVKTLDKYIHSIESNR